MGQVDDGVGGGRCGVVAPDEEAGRADAQDGAAPVEGLGGGVGDFEGERHFPEADGGGAAALGAEAFLEFGEQAGDVADALAGAGAEAEGDEGCAGDGCPGGFCAGVNVEGGEGAVDGVDFSV